MTNIPPRDPTPPRGPLLSDAKADRRNYIAIAAIAVVLVVGAIFYFSSQDPAQDASETSPATTEPAPATNAPADNNTGTTTP